MRNCIDDGTLQSWFDGELNVDAAANVTAHVNTCAQCAEAVREIEAESSIVAQALTAEFAEAVPTERLRQRIDAAVAGLQPVRPQAASRAGWRDTISDFLASFRPRTLAYAAMAAVVLLVGFFGFVYLKGNRVAPLAANPPTNQVAPQTPTESPELIVRRPDVEPVSNLPQAPVVRAKHTTPPSNQTAALLKQERGYEKEIANLKAAIKSNPAMRPTLQVEYEHNLALVDHAITTTRDAAKKNPKDPQAAQFMFAAYQSKVDLLNQIADVRTLER